MVVKTRFWFLNLPDAGGVAQTSSTLGPASVHPVDGDPRAGAHAPDFTSPRQIRARLISDVALSTGALALAQMRSDVWQLPFDTILVPLRRSAGHHES